MQWLRGYGVSVLSPDKQTGVSFRIPFHTIVEVNSKWKSYFTRQRSVRASPDYSISQDIFPFLPPVYFLKKWAMHCAELYYSPYWTLGSLSCSSQTGPNSQNAKEDAFSFHKSLNLGLDDFCKHSFLHRFLWGLGKLIWLLLQCARHRFVFTSQCRVICL